MFVKCSYCDGVDNVLINFPETEEYEIRFRYRDGLYLILPNKEIMLRDVDHWCDGRPNLPAWAVGDLYSEIVDVVTELLINDKKINCINIDEIEGKLLKKYEKEWSSLGYITIDEDGSW